MSQVQHNPEGVAKALAEAINKQFEELLDSGAQELRGPVRDISLSMALAARRGNQALLESCQDQLALAMQEAQYEVKDGFESALDFLVDRGVTLLVNGAIAGLKGLRVTP